MKKLFVVLSLVLLAGCSKVTSDVDTPSNIEVNDGVITWDVVENATYMITLYDVLNDANSKEYKDISESEFTFPSLMDNRYYEVKVQAKVNDELSLPSSSVYFDTYEEVSTLNFNYNTLTSTEYSVVLSDVSRIDYLILNKDVIDLDEKLDFEFEDGIVSFEEHKLSSNDLVIVYAYTDLGVYKIKLNKVTLDVPSLIGEATVVFDDTDVYYNFDLAEGGLTGLSGNDITSKDYQISNNIVMIEKEYIKGLFDGDESRGAVILAYQIEVNGNITIGYLFINREAK